MKTFSALLALCVCVCVCGGGGGGESTGHRRIPLRKAGDAKLWSFLWSAPEQTVKQTIETLVIWHPISLIMMPL